MKLKIPENSLFAILMRSPWWISIAIAGALLDELVERTGATHLEATVTPSNLASETLFRRFGARNGAPVATDELFSEELFPPGHEAEILFRIGPLGKPAA